MNAVKLVTQIFNYKTRQSAESQGHFLENVERVREQSKCLTRSWETLSESLLKPGKKYLKRSKMMVPRGGKIKLPVCQKALDSVLEETDQLSSSDPKR